MRDCKILFDLRQDDDGYPPFSAEAVWAKELQAGNFQIQNIPFYVRGLSRGDIVSALQDKSTLRYENTIVKPENSTFRAVFFDLEIIPVFALSIERLGCDHEWHRNLVAINAESKTKSYALVEMLNLYHKEGGLDYEEAALRY